MIALKTKGETKTVEVREWWKEPPGTEDLCCGETEGQKRKERFEGFCEHYFSVFVIKAGMCDIFFGILKIVTLVIVCCGE